MIRVKFRFGTANRKEMSLMSETSGLMDTLRQEGISPDLLRAVEEYRAAHPLAEALRPRIPAPAFVYYGREVWEQALAALLCGENLLLAGGKATGKNVLAENLAAAFGRPAWDISFHVNMDAASLIGMDTFEGGQVKFRPGPVYRCAQSGGFGVLDEINMAKNEALAVLHAVLDFRRAIDVPGYDRIPLAEETRFIATMNYGYAGTRELNEALTSRFVVIQMPTITQDNLEKLLRAQFPELAIMDYVHMEEWYWRNGGYARTSGAMGEVLEKTYVCNERTRRVLIQDFGRKPESVETLYIGVDQELYDAEKRRYYYRDMKQFVPVAFSPLLARPIQK